MKRIALKIDVDTFRGAHAAVPAILPQLAKHEARATFFLSLGPDQSGRERRSHSLSAYYDFPTRLAGVLMPSKDIGSHCADVFKQIQAEGHETAIHCWNRVRWERRVMMAENDWIETEMYRACVRFAELFGHPATAHGAAGWMMNRHALRLTQRLGFKYASDSRGSHPFIPVIDGEVIACPQIPTTLPTLDETLALEPERTAEQAIDRIVQLARALPGEHVLTVRAELEGLKFPSSMERLLAGGKEAGLKFVALEDLAASLDANSLPRHVVEFVEIPGRRGKRMNQGREFLKPAHTG